MSSTLNRAAPACLRGGSPAGWPNDPVRGRMKSWKWPRTRTSTWFAWDWTGGRWRRRWWNSRPSDGSGKCDEQKLVFRATVRFRGNRLGGFVIGGRAADGTASQTAAQGCGIGGRTEDGTATQIAAQGRGGSVRSHQVLVEG